MTSKIFLALLAAAAIAETRAAAPTYHVTDLGIPAGQQIIAPAALNNQAQVAASTENFAYRFNAGTWENLGTLPGGNVSSAFAIDNFGRVVGDSQFTNGGAIRHATLFNGGTVTDLGTLPNFGNYSHATGINASGQVVGYVSPTSSSSSTHAFIWDATNGIREIAPSALTAPSINDAGSVTGTYRVPGTFNARHAYIWDSAASLRGLGTLVTQSGTTSPETFSSGAFINRDGHVAGNSAINTFDSRQHAFLHDGTTMRDLGSLGPNDAFSDRSSAYGINRNEEVVGTSYRPYNGGALYQVAFVYRNGTMYDLEKLVDASGADYRLNSAVAINDNSQILVDAVRISTNQRRALVLTPNPAATDFTVVIDSTTPGYRGFGAFPTINDSGSVAFYAEPTPGAGNTYKIDPSAAPVFLEQGGTGGPVINNLGEVASRRLIGNGPIEFYKGTSSVDLRVIARTGSADGTFRLFPGYIYLADTGTAVFAAELNPINPRRRGIYTGNGDGTTSVVVDNTGQFAVFGADPTLDNSGTVAFTASLVNTENGLYLGSVGGNGVTSTVLTAAGTPLYAFDGSPFLNDHGQIAFKANEDATAQAGLFTVNRDGTGLRTIASAGNGPFSQFRAPIINDLGTVAFFGFTDAGGTGISPAAILWPTKLSRSAIRSSAPPSRSSASSAG